VPVVYTLMHQSIPGTLSRIFRRGESAKEPGPALAGD